MNEIDWEILESIYIMGYASSIIRSEIKIIIQMNP